VNADDLIRFVDNRPFEPFTMFVADGREVNVPHAEMATTGRFGWSVHLVHDSGQVEVVDGASICSLRTMHPSSTSFQEEPPPEDSEPEE
jgi:hypothetical protein